MRSTDSTLSYLHILLGFISPSISLRIVSFAAARDRVTQAPRPRACVTPPERRRVRLLFEKLKIDRSVRDFISFEIVTFSRCF